MPKLNKPLQDKAIELAAKGLSQLEISNALGVTQGYVSKLLQGKTSSDYITCTCKDCPVHGTRPQKCGYTIANLSPCNREKGHEGPHYSGATAPDR